MEQLVGDILVIFTDFLEVCHEIMECRAKYLFAGSENARRMIT